MERQDSARAASVIGKYLIVALVLAIAGIVLYGKLGERGTSERERYPSPPQETETAPPQEIPASPVPRVAEDPRAPDVPHESLSLSSPETEFSPQGAEEVFALVAPGVVVVDAYDSGNNRVALGSGVVVEKGYVVTNRHVVERGTEIRVRHGERSYTARVRYADREYDLCGLSVDGLPANPVGVGDVTNLRVGQRVYAVGAPQGLELSLSEGVVSSLRPMEGTFIIQTTAAVSSGSSGGGLFDDRGTLVGITTFAIREGQNLNFALPAEMIADLPARSADIRSLSPVSTDVGAILPEASANASRAKKLMEAINRKKSDLDDLQEEIIKKKSEIDQAVLAVQQMQTTMMKHQMENNHSAYNEMVPKHKKRVEKIKDMEQRHKDRQLEYLDEVKTLNKMVAEYNTLPR
jgi:S1-C subfamily serine protease